MAINLKTKNHDQLMLFTGNSNPQLANEVAKLLNVKMGEALVGRFPEGEIHVLPVFSCRCSAFHHCASPCYIMPSVLSEEGHGFKVHLGGIS